MKKEWTSQKAYRQLEAHGFKIKKGIISLPQWLKDDFDAIDYLCNEFDHVYDPEETIIDTLE